jgi:hypothetical protein
LSPCFEDPICDTLVTENAVCPSQLTANDNKYQTFLDGINQKYPQCDPGLALALSKALYDSTMRLHAERLTASAEAVTKSGPYSGGLPKDSGYETSLGEASQQHSTSPRDDSIGAGSTYARTLASIDDGDDGITRTPFPSQPRGLKIGDKFPCIACGRSVSKSERTSAWRYSYSPQLLKAGNKSQEMANIIPQTPPSLGPEAVDMLSGVVRLCPHTVPHQERVAGTSTSTARSASSLERQEMSILPPRRGGWGPRDDSAR